MAATVVSDHGQTVLVTTPYDMASVLFSASACGAASYALAAHENACEEGDDQRVEFWHEVCRELTVLRDRLDRAA